MSPVTAEGAHSVFFGDLLSYIFLLLLLNGGVVKLKGLFFQWNLRNYGIEYIIYRLCLIAIKHREK